MKPGPTPPAIKTKIVKAIHLAHVLDSKAFFPIFALARWRGAGKQAARASFAPLIPSP
jgi:hypothetical protein